MSELDQLTFKESDCLIQGAKRQVGANLVPVIHGVPQANILSGRQMTERERNAITVVHIPTGISFTADTGGPQVNRKTAIAKVKAMVEQAIEEAKERYAASLQGDGNN